MTGCLRSFGIASLILSCVMVRAQQLVPDTASGRITADRAVKAYDDFMGGQSRLYNGIEQVGYLPMTGHPYFNAEDVRNGSIVYEGVYYHDVSMLYDIVKGQVLVANRNGNLLGLSNDWIREFFLDGHHFINTSSGYYDLMCSGTVSLLVKRQKSIAESIEGMTIVRTVEDHTHYYIVRGGVYHPIGNLHALLALLRDKKKEINQDLRKKKIKYRKGPEAAIVEAARYYNQTVHS
jgi:hypothetical protein